MSFEEKVWLKLSLQADSSCSKDVDDRAVSTLVGIALGFDERSLAGSGIEIGVGGSFLLRWDREG